MGVFSSNSVRRRSASISTATDTITVTRGYDYVLFREQDSEYTFIENETAFLLPRRSFEDLESVARHRIETISDLDVETGLRISVWEVRGSICFYAGYD